jgi:glycosyltransferase involved in cell wall biosynthesis
VNATDAPGAPLVSVVIPTYNHARVLGRALASVVAQTVRDWEAIVVNNHSTDDTRAVVERIGDPRIGLVDYANHGVIAASRNEGIRRARGRYVAFLDSDDEWMPEKLEACLALMHPEVGLVGHGELWRDAAGHDRPMVYGPAERTTYDALLWRGNCISTSAVVVRTDALRAVGGFDEDPAIVTTEDYDLWLRLAHAGVRMAFTPRMLGVFHRHPDSMSSAADRHLRAELALLARHFGAGPAAATTRLRRRHRIARAHYGAGRQLRREPAAALRAFATALAISPFTWRAYPAAAIAVGDALRRARGGRA